MRWFLAFLAILVFGDSYAQLGSTYTLNTSTVPADLLACPAGDGGSFIDHGFTIDIWARFLGGAPIAFVPPADIWMIDCDPLRDAVLCGGGQGSSHADHLTGPDGFTTMSQTALAAGGCVSGLSLVIQGVIVPEDPEVPSVPGCLPIDVRSVDLNGDLLVNVVDLSLFALEFPPNAPTFPNCADFNFDEVVNIVDLATFAFHFGPPGHICQ